MKKKKSKRQKDRKRMKKKIGMNINEKKNRSFAQLNILHISRAIRSFIRPCDCRTSIDLFTATSHTRRLVIRNVLRKMVKNQQFEQNDRRRNIVRSIKLIP